MGKKYDARKMTELCDTLDYAVKRYTAHAEMLENEYEKYNSNNTYRGEAADASKEFVYKGQGKLLKEQLRVLNKLNKKFRETQDAFSSLVDSSPNAKIDTDVIEYDKRYLEQQKESFEENAWQMERVTREMADKFERFGFLTRVNADRARYGFEDMCGYNGLLNKSLRKFEEFDEESKAYLKQSGLDIYMYDLETDTKATMNALDGMTIYNPDVKKITVTPIAQMAAKMMAVASAQSVANKQNSSKLKLAALNAAMPYEELNPEVLRGIETIIYDILMAGGYAIDQIKEVVKQIPALLAFCLSDGPSPAFDIISIGVIAIETILIIIRVSEYLWDNHCLRESRKDSKSDTKVKNKGSSKDKQKEKAKQDPPSKGESSENQDSKTKSKPNSAKLRRNMVNSGMPEPDYPHAAHHIVAGGAAAAQRAREILEKYNIDINDPNNGIFLPTVRGVSEATYHRAMHTAEYYNKVIRLLEEASSQEECIAILRYIAKKLADGTF